MYSVFISYSQSPGGHTKSREGGEAVKNDDIGPKGNRYQENLKGFDPLKNDFRLIRNKSPHITSGDH